MSNLTEKNYNIKIKELVLKDNIFQGYFDEAIQLIYDNPDIEIVPIIFYWGVDSLPIKENGFPDYAYEKERVFEEPTTEQKNKINELIDNKDWTNLLSYLRKNIWVQWDSARDETNRTPYMRFMFDFELAYHNPELFHKIFRELIRCHPNPFLKDVSGKRSVYKNILNVWSRVPIYLQSGFSESLMRAKGYEISYLLEMRNTYRVMNRMSNKNKDKKSRSVNKQSNKKKCAEPGCAMQGGFKKTRKAKGRGRKTMKRRR